MKKMCFHNNSNHEYLNTIVSQMYDQEGIYSHRATKSYSSRTHDFEELIFL